MLQEPCFEAYIHFLLRSVVSQIMTCRRAGLASSPNTFHGMVDGESLL